MSKHSWLILLVLVIVFFITSLFVFSEQTRPKDFREYCEPYKPIPEEHLNRIPDVCLPYYYEGRNE